MNRSRVIRAATGEIIYEPKLRLRLVAMPSSLHEIKCNRCGKTSYSFDRKHHLDYAPCEECKGHDTVTLCPPDCTGEYE